MLFAWVANAAIIRAWDRCDRGLFDGSASATGCFVSSIIGVLLVTRAVRRTGKASALVLILSGIIGLGAVLTGETKAAHPSLLHLLGLKKHKYITSTA